MRVQYIIEPDGHTRQAEHVLGPAVGFITWADLFNRVFRAGGEIGFHDRVPTFQTDDRGITYTVSSNPPPHKPGKAA